MCYFNKALYLKDFDQEVFMVCPIHSYSSLKDYTYKFAIIDPTNFDNSSSDTIDVNKLTGCNEQEPIMPILEFGFSDKIYHETTPDHCF